MDAKCYLEKYRKAQYKADRLREKYEELAEQYDSVGCPLLSDGRGSGISKPTERKVEKTVAALERWQIAQLDALEIRQGIFEKVITIPGKECDILIERYINFQTWEKICEIVDCSKSAAHRMHHAGLQVIQGIIDQ